MKVILSTAERQRIAERLERILRLAERPGSPGEFQAAQSAAGRILCAKPDFWLERLTQPISASSPKTESGYEPTVPAWRDVARACADKPASLNSWERRFLSSILRRSGQLTDKQRRCLGRIAERLGVNSGAG